MTPQQSWDTYCASKIALLTPILKKHGYVLDFEQPHIKGERFLMQAVTTTSGKKIILVGKNIRGINRMVRDNLGNIKKPYYCSYFISYNYNSI